MASTTPEVVVKEEQPLDDLETTQLLQEPKEVTLDSVRCLVNTRDLAKLECGVDLAREILDQLRLPMADAKQQDDQIDWLNKIDRLKDTSTTASRTTVAVVGQTGAGKSSLINALLDEEELLPTSGMRACTAVASEIIWNVIDDPEQAYRAEIEFRSKQDWNEELVHLLEDVVEDNSEDNQDQPSWGDPTSDAGIAYAKIRAVHPELTHKQLLNSKPERLAQHPRVSQVLGTTKEIACSTAVELAAELSKYLDSVDKNTQTDSKETSGGLALWPLIKVARIYCKSSVLAGGIVIVDLPGTVDTNAARNVVSAEYLAQSNAVFVVAPIKRAVDDKSAKELMGKAFKLQLLMDGNYSNVTFICSSCDDINVNESIKSLDKDRSIRRAIAQRRQLIQSVEDKSEDIHKLKKQARSLVNICNALRKDLKEWKKHNKNIAKGRPVFVSRVPSKRKHSEKETHQTLDDSESDSDDDEQITAEEVKAKLEYLEEQLQVKSAERADAEERGATTEAELERLEKELEKPELDGTRLCIQKRNSECKKAIQTDFANGVKEIDEAGEDDAEATFGLSNRKRDYSLVARSLPVFSISSKAYQHFQRRAEQCDDSVRGFVTAEDTGLPALQTHTKMLTKEDQIQKCKFFLTDFLTLLSSLVVVTAACSQLDAHAVGSKAIELTQQQRDEELEHLNIRIDDLVQQSRKVIFKTKDNLLTVSRKRLTYKDSQAVRAGARSAERIIVRWYTPEGKGGFGLKCNSYKAICRRLGAKTPSPKARDFNADLLEPYMAQMSTSWESLFGDEVPKLLDTVAPFIRVKLEEFHAQIAARLALKQCRHASLRFLGKHLEEHQQAVSRATGNAMAEIQVIQREASRSFYPRMQDCMKKTYTKCASTSGKGCYQVMKDIMSSMIAMAKGANLYKNISKAAIKSVEETFQKIAIDLDEDISHAIKDLIYSDYQRMITAGERMEASVVALGHCHSVLGGVDDRFRAILDAEFDASLTPDAMSSQSE